MLRSDETLYTFDGDEVLEILMEYLRENNQPVHENTYITINDREVIVKTFSPKEEVET